MCKRRTAIILAALCAAVFGSGCQPRPPEPVTAVRLPAARLNDPSLTGDTTVLVRCVKTYFYATTTRGKWRTQWFLHVFSVIRTEKGRWPHSGLSLVWRKSLPLPGSGWYVKMAQCPYAPGRVFTMDLDTTKSPAQIVSSERRSCLPPHAKLTWTARRKPEKAVFDRVTAKVHERARRVGTRTELPIWFVEATRDSYVVSHGRETLVLDKKSLKVSPFGLTTCAAGSWQKGPWIWKRVYPRAKLGLRGKVVQGGCLIRPIGLGARQGLREGDILDVYRGKEKIGRVEVRTVWPGFAGVVVIQRSRPVKPGDEVVLSELAPSLEQCRRLVTEWAATPMFAKGVVIFERDELEGVRRFPVQSPDYFRLTRKPIAALGGPRRAASAMARYLKSPEHAAPGKPAAVWLLGGCGEHGILGLSRALTHPNARVRWEAAFVLGELGGLARSAKPELQRALKDRDEKVRQAAAEALKKIRAAQKEKDK